jgi:alginate O-acetyltransferase complex protein AlgI
MLFTSATFLFLFTPLVLAGHGVCFYLARRSGHPDIWRQGANLWLLLGSLVFYVWSENVLVWIMLGTVALNYLAGLFVEKVGGAFRWLGLVGVLVVNLGVLGYFKYANFASEQLDLLWGFLGFGQGPLHNLGEIALPLGISFYTFQSLSYTIDVYRREVKPTRNLIDFACYVTLFPQLVAGPIIRYVDVASALRERMPARDLFASGVMRFVTGLGKKILLANSLGFTADTVFALDPGVCSPGMLWGALVAYTLQIYFDFSGYSDMAIGLGRMLGFDFIENFNYPYIARSMRDFWRRWHISLSTWFRDYLYVPLGGSRRNPRRTLLNLLLVFFLCGLWHGAEVHYIVWGLYHGVFLVVERLLSGKGGGKFPRPIQHLYTLMVVMLGWVFFRAGSVKEALAFLEALWIPRAPALAFTHRSSWLPWPSLMALLLAIPLATPIFPRMVAWMTPDRALTGPVTAWRGLLLVLLMLLILLLVYIQIVSGSYNPFLYFRF